MPHKQHRYRLPTQRHSDWPRPRLQRRSHHPLTLPARRPPVKTPPQFSC
jgi:hypothetical protein